MHVVVNLGGREWPVANRATTCFVSDRLGSCLHHRSAEMRAWMTDLGGRPRRGLSICQSIGFSFLCTCVVISPGTALPPHAEQCRGRQSAILTAGILRKTDESAQAIRLKVPGRFG